MRASSTRLWIVPLLCLGAALVLVLGTLAIDRASDYDLISSKVTGSPTAVQTALSTIVTAMITLISVVLTVMTVAVQLAMGQFSPRIVAALLRDRGNQLVFGLFGATGVYAILALTKVDEQKGQIPGLTVVIAYALTLTSLAVLILFVNRAGERLRASGLIDLVGDELHAQIERRFAPDDDDSSPAANVIQARSPGIVTQIDRHALVELASRAGCVLELTARMGDFVPGGAALLHVREGDPTRVAGAARHVKLEDERTHELDPAYGFRKLVDIAVRSASQDPGTTVEAIHRIHDCMRQLAPRRFPSGRHADASGRVRLIEPVRGWNDYVLLAFEEIRLAGMRSPQVTRRLRAALEDLETVAPPERLAALEEQLELLEADVRRAFEDETDARVALAADPQGLG
ncbi:MAG TPA: DUF2254 domain-containing protein [Solirubrobacteraceae bacterium]